MVCRHRHQFGSIDESPSSQIPDCFIRLALFPTFFPVNVFHLCLCPPLISKPIQPRVTEKQPHVGLISGISWWAAWFKWKSYTILTQLWSRTDLSPMICCVFDMWYDIWYMIYDIFLLLKKCQTSPLIGFEFNLREKMLAAAAAVCF